MNAGDVFQFVGIADIHAWTIISDPENHPDRVLIVNFTTWDPRIDQACVLWPGAHPFIVARTCVNYPRSRIVTDAVLEQLRAAGRLRMHPPLSPQLPREIRESAMFSTKITLEAADVLTEQGLVN
jgi:hypothetical protein